MEYTDLKILSKTLKSRLGFGKLFEFNERTYLLTIIVPGPLTTTFPTCSSPQKPASHALPVIMAEPMLRRVLFEIGTC